MFQNAFQSGNFLEVFDAKVNKEKDKFYEKLYKIINPSGVNKIYDKNIKSYIFEMEGGIKTKIQFPKEDKQDLGLIQHYLVFQLYLPIGAPFSIEITITDTAKNKRRLNFTTAVNKIDKNYFHAKIPIDIIKRGVWLNLSLDLLSFFELFKGQTFRSIDSIIIGATCKLKRIFTMKSPLIEFAYDDEVIPQSNNNNAQLVPKTQNYLPGVAHSNQLITLDLIMRNSGEEFSEIPEHINSTDDVSSSIGAGLTNSLKGKSVTLSTKETKGEPHRIATKQENRSEIKSRVDNMHAPLTADSSLKSNKENLDHSTKLAMWNKNAPKFGSGNYSQEVAQKRTQLSVKGNSDQRSLSPTRPREEKSLGPHSKLRSDSEIEEESKDDIQNTNRVTKEILLDPGKKLRIQSTAKPQMKSPIIPEKNLVTKESEKSLYNPPNTGNKSGKMEKKSGVNNPWLENSETNMKKKNSKSNLLTNVPNSLPSPISKEVKSRSNDPHTVPFDKSGYIKSTSENKEIGNSRNQLESAKSTVKQFSTTNGSKGSSKSNGLHKQQSKKNPQEFEEEAKIDQHNKYSSMINKSPNITTTNPKFVQSTQKKKNGLQSEKYERNNGLNNNDDIESIEENLEYEINNNSVNLSDQLHNSSKIDKTLGDVRNNNKNYSIKYTTTHDINHLTDEHSTSPVKDNKKKMNKSENQNENIDDFTDSLEIENFANKSHNQKNMKFETFGKNNNKIDQSPQKIITETYNKNNGNNDGENKKKNTYEDQLNNVINKIRPFSPPFSSTLLGAGIGDNVTMITRKNDEIVVFNNDGNNQNDVMDNNSKDDINKEDNLLEVIYDPVLNCYYHPKTNSYYELKFIYYLIALYSVYEELQNIKFN